MARIRILHQGGQPFLALPLRETARMLAKSGHEVSISLLSESPLSINQNPKAADYAAETIPGVDCRYFNLWSRRLPQSSVCMAVKYAEFFVRQLLGCLCAKADLYIGFNSETVLMAYLAARLRRKKVIYYNDELSAHRNVPGRKVWAAIDRFTCRRVDWVVACHPGRAEFLRTQGSIPYAPMVIPNVSEYRDLPRNASLRDFITEQGGGGITHVVIYQGGLSESRYALEMVQAFKYLPEETALVLLGHADRAMREGIDAVIKEEDLEGRIFFHPYLNREDLLQRTASADVGLMLIRDDCLNARYYAPTKLFEYWMAGVPVVCSDLPWNRELVEKVGGGVVVSDHSPQSIAESIQSVLENEEGWEAMSKRCRQAVREEYNWEVQAGPLLELVESLLSEC